MNHAIGSSRRLLVVVLDPDRDGCIFEVAVRSSA